MNDKMTNPPERKYYIVREDKGYFVVPEAMIQKMIDSVLPKIQVFGIPMAFLAISITLAKDVVLLQLTKSSLILIVFGSCLFFIFAIVIAIYLYKLRNKQLSTLEKIKASKHEALLDQKN